MSERLVSIDEYAAHDGPLLRECRACGALVGISCTIGHEPHPDDVSGRTWVRSQVLEFHESRLRGDRSE